MIVYYYTGIRIYQGGRPVYEVMETRIKNERDHFNKLDTPLSKLASIVRVYEMAWIDV